MKTTKLRKPKISLRPAQVIALGFLGVVFLGAFFICLPVSSADGTWMHFIDALFTATSAVSTTGLMVVPDTATYFSVFGQIVLLVLIQFGGVGFMCITTLIMMLIKKKITLKDRLLMCAEFNQETTRGMVRLGRNIMLVTLGIEAVGFLLLIYPFVKHSGPIGIWQALFTSVSAFCNAGFDVMGTGNSLGAFADNVTVNLSVSFLIILGGLGFAVLMDIGKNKLRFGKYSLHTKIALVTSGILILIGWVFFFGAEYGNDATMGQMSPAVKLLASLFQSVSPRSTGFATVEQSSLTSASKFMTVFLMFIGASPASTGGGIRTTTLAVLLLIAVNGLSEKADITVGKHKITHSTARKAVSVFMLSLILVLVSCLVLFISEHGTAPAQSFENILFECFSAYTTAGLTCGLSAMLSPLGKIILIINMFLGRVGMLTIGLVFISNKGNKDNIGYPDGNIMVG